MIGSSYKSNFMILSMNGNLTPSSSCSYFIVYVFVLFFLMLHFFNFFTSSINKEEGEVYLQNKFKL